MKGPAWNRVVREEQQRFRTALRGKRKLAKEIAKELEQASQESSRPLFETKDVLIGAVGTMAIRWSWKEEEGTWHEAADLDNVNGWVFEIADDSDGGESYTCTAYRPDHSKAWVKKNVGPAVCVKGGKCYLTEVKRKLVSYRLVSVAAETGQNLEILWEEKDPRYNLELVRRSGTGSEGCFLKRQAGERCDLFWISAAAASGLVVVDGISLEARQYVLGQNLGEVLTWTAREGWTTSRGFQHHLPSFQEAVPECLDTGRGLLVTRWKGVRTLWKLSRRDPALVLWKGIGQIKIDSWLGPWVCLETPGQPALWWNCLTIRPPALKAVAELHESRDGVPFVYVKPTSGRKPKGLLCIAYGAYGIPTSLSTDRWEPLRARGWGICIGLFRGGGDHTPEWEHTGRVKGRETVLQEAEAFVRAAQSVTGCGAETTVLYGRSAGGLWAGGLAARFPQGDLAANVYMEVPYLDVLRTVTNPNLPLTLIETDDFALPAQRLSDFMSVLRWSPMELLALNAGAGTPGIRQLVRTGLNDPQVYAYESVKWVTRCRGGEETRPILLAIEGGQGHFVYGRTGTEQKAMDLAILLSQMQK